MGERPAVRVAGVDGCPRGWVAVTLTRLADPAGPAPRGHRPAGRDAAAAIPRVTVTVARALGALPLAPVTGIDMPLGLLAASWRDADRLARRALGRRGASVFAIPPRPALEAPSYGDANRTCRELTGQGLSVQAYGLRRKIAEAEAWRQAATPAGCHLYEVHPELSFAALAGAPLAASKHTPAGLAERRRLLAAAGLMLPPEVPGVPENDLLDAAAVAWSARRIADGLAVTLTNPAQRADDGSEIAIRY